MSNHLNDHYRAFDSRNLVSAHSAAGGFPPPVKLSSRSALPHSSLTSNVPLPSCSPMSTSPSSPTGLLESSLGLPRTSRELRQGLTASSGRGQPNLPRILSSEQTSPSISSSSVTPVDSRLLQTRRNHREPGNPIPSFAHETSDSSKSSLASTWSSTSTAASSLYAYRGLEDDSKLPIVLPPLSAVAGLAGGTVSLTDHALRSSHRPPLGSGSVSYVSQLPHTLYASPSGTDIDSLVLPVPHKIAFGQKPEPWPETSTKLANIFDIQDIPGERHSGIVKSGIDAHEPTHMSHDRPPGIRQLSSNSKSPDPLSVLADAAHANHNLQSSRKNARPSR